MNSILFSLRILKTEYTKTKFKNIDKSRFPQLLNKLFETEAIKDKNNIIQSFKRAGIFPLNSESVDVSRILKNNKFTAKSSTTTNASSNDSMNNSSAPVNFVSPNNNHHNSDNDPSNLNRSRSSHNVDVPSSFASSREAISTLQDVLQDTIISYGSDDDDDNNNNDDDDDNDVDDNDDEDYIPPKSVFASSKTISSTKTSKSENHQLVASKKSNKRKVSWDLSSTDSTEEGNFYI